MQKSVYLNKCVFLSALQIIENGVIFFGMKTDDFSPTEFTSVDEEHLGGVNPFVTPYWIDNDVSQGGSIQYDEFTSGTETLLEINEFISLSEDVEFCGRWMLVTQWNDVSLFGSLDDFTVSNSRFLMY